MKIYARTTYHLDGCDFRSLKDAQTHVHNELGKVLDSTPLRMDPKQALAVHAAIIANRARLVELLTVEIESPADDSEPRNLLDMDL